MCYPKTGVFEPCQRMEGMILKVTKMLEPLIIMVMGVTIAGVMLAIYMPMFEMAGKVK